MKKHFIFILLVIINVCVVKPQVPESPMAFLTPNAASLGQFGDTPVSLFTGTPEINIPLYTVEFHGYQLPISLSYHASGIRPDQHPGWVGLGWCLNAGGMISRKVNHFIDEEQTTGFLSQHSILSPSKWNTLTFMDSLINKNYQGIPHYLYDMCPDEFIFSFGPYHGSFFIGDDSLWHVKADKEIRVEMTGKMKPPLKNRLKKTTGITTDNLFKKYINGFRLTTDDGVKYVFGGDSTSVEYSVPFWQQNTIPWIPTAWMLREIILPNSEKITFSYERGDLQVEMYFGGKNSSSYYQDINYNGTQVYPLAYAYNGMLLAPVYLSEIKADNISIRFQRTESTELPYNKQLFVDKFGCIVNGHQENFNLPYVHYDTDPITSTDFVDNLHWQKLNTITVIEHPYGNNGILPGGEIKKSIVFHYSNDSTRRLTLNGVTVGPQDFSFEYNHVEALPGYLSCKTDHWGYFNNRVMSRSFCEYTRDVLTRNMSKSPDKDYMGYGMLTKVIYPTGGYTRFEYEPHTYRYVNKRDSVPQEPGYAGGLRIKRIINSPDSTNEVVQHRFFYSYAINSEWSDFSSSSGVLFYEPIYHYKFTMKATNSSDTMCINDYNFMPITPESSEYSGGHIGYTYVIDQLSDGSYTRYHFSNFDDEGGMNTNDTVMVNYQGTRNRDYVPVSTRTQDRGLLLDETSYDSNGNAIVKVSHSYERNTEDGSDEYVRAMESPRPDDDRNYNMYSQEYFNMTSFKIYTYLNRVKTDTITEYDGTGNTHRDIRTYSYSGNKLVSEIKREVGGLTDRQTFRYATTLSIGAAGDMAEQHILTPLLEYNRYITYPGVSEERAEKTLVDYGSFYFPSKTIYAPINTYHGYATNSPKLELTFNNYDRYGNVNSVTTPSNVETVYVWGYHGRKLIAKVENASYAEVTAILGNLSTFAEQQEPDYSLLNQLYTSLPDARVSIYSHDLTYGLSDISDFNHLSTHYKYDLYGRLKGIYDNDHHVVNWFDYNYVVEPSHH